MKCLICEALSLSLVCKDCDKRLAIFPNKRLEQGGFCIYSFYEYQSIELLLKSKYSLIGSRIYKYLAKKACKYFSDEVKGDFSKVYAIGIDDRVEQFYSHSGVIVKGFSKVFKPLFGTLKASNDIHYAGKSLKYRQENKKGFVYSGKCGIDAVLIDDIITSGESIKEAKAVLEKSNVNVLFALTLSDARS